MAYSGGYEGHRFQHKDGYLQGRTGHYTDQAGENTDNCLGKFNQNSL